MPRKRYKPEEIVANDVLVSHGQHIADAIRQIGVNEVTYLKELEQENTRLRRAISELTLNKLILQEGVRGKLLSPARRPKRSGLFSKRCYPQG